MMIHVRDHQGAGAVLSNWLMWQVVSGGIRHWPHPCFLCGAAGRYPHVLCPPCREGLPQAASPACPRCGEALQRSLPCRCCALLQPAFEDTVAAFAYRYPVDVLVRRLKYGGVLHLSGMLASRLIEAVSGQALPEVLVAMPLSRRRWRRRGYNQAWEIASRVAAHYRLPLGRGLERVRETPPQAGLGVVERRDNLIGAFRCDGTLAGRTVALVDDVMTSGANLDAAARALKAAGVRRVSAWVVARTPGPDFQG